MRLQILQDELWQMTHIEDLIDESRFRYPCFLSEEWFEKVGDPDGMELVDDKVI